MVFDRLPNCTHHGDSIEAFYDRGYGKKTAMVNSSAKGYNLHTVAAASGSRWLTRDEVDKKIGDWRKGAKLQPWIDRRIKLIKDWILPECEHIGSVVKVAKREFTSENGKKCYIYAFALHEVHDPKTPSQWLRFFASGSSLNLTQHIFVAMRKCSGLSSNTLFSLAVTPNPKQQKVKENLNKLWSNFHRPEDWLLVQGQRDANQWHHVWEN